MMNVQELQKLLEDQLNGRIPDLPGAMLEQALNNPNYAKSFLAKQNLIIEDLKKENIALENTLKSKPADERKQEQNQQLALAMNIALRTIIVQFVMQKIMEQAAKLENAQVHSQGGPSAAHMAELEEQENQNDETHEYKEPENNPLKNLFEDQLAEHQTFDAELAEEPEKTLNDAIDNEADLLKDQLQKEFPNQEEKLTEAASNLSEVGANNLESPAPAIETETSSKRKSPFAIPSPGDGPSPFGGA